MSRNKLLILFIFMLSSCARTPSIKDLSWEERGGSLIQVGIASYYGEEFEGRPTASGEIYSGEELTAAHRKLPFGTIVKVINLRNGKNIFLKINDRGPFVDMRIIDVSKRAAAELDFINEGVVNVRLELPMSMSKSPGKLNSDHQSQPD